VTDVIAHRGAAPAERENTVAAFRRAVELGADGVELDVRPTADGALVVHHDPRLPDGRPIVATDRADLPDHVPDLAAALDACAGVVVNVELKNDPADPDFDPADRLADAVVELLASRPEPADRWLLSSFRRETIDRVRVLAPDLATAYLVTGADAAAIEACRRHGHGTLHPWVGALTAAGVAAAKAAGLVVNTWTCNDAAQARRVAAWGVDGIVTDAPDVIRAALTRPPEPAAPA